MAPMSVEQTKEWELKRTVTSNTTLGGSGLYRWAWNVVYGGRCKDKPNASDFMVAKLRDPHTMPLVEDRRFVLRYDVVHKAYYC